MEVFDISTLPVDLILNLINIALLYLIVRMLVYKPVRKFLDARKEKVSAQLSEAEKAKAEAAEYKARYEEVLRDSEAHAREIIRCGEDEAAEKAAHIVEEANQKAESILREATLRTEAERRDTLDAMKGEIASLAVDISEKLLQREITDQDNRKIAEDFFAEAHGQNQ